MATAVDKQQNLLMSPQRVNYPDLADWIALELQPTDVVVLEACSNTWTLCDQLAPQVAQVMVVRRSRVSVPMR
jgi:hypothetical protein